MTKNNRDYRDINEPLETEQNYMVTGYATTFDRYPLMIIDGIQYYEQIEPTAFIGTDTSDVIMQYDHTGKVFARTNNKTLIIEVDDKGLKVTADLSKTNASREMYQEIKEKMITKMSYAFSVETERYDTETRTRHITKVKKVYDVSSVSRPANLNTEITTEISARTYLNGLLDEQNRIKRARKRAEAEYTYLLKLNQTKGSI